MGIYFNVNNFLHYYINVPFTGIIMFYFVILKKNATWGKPEVSFYFHFTNVILICLSLNYPFII